MYKNTSEHMQQRASATLGTSYLNVDDLSEQERVENLRLALIRKLEMVEKGLAATPKTPNNRQKRLALTKEKQDMERQLTAIRGTTKAGKSPPQLDQYFVDAAKEFLTGDQFRFLVKKARERFEQGVTRNE